MTALALTPRAAPYQAVQFEAFRVSEVGGKWRTFPFHVVGLTPPTTLAQFVAAAAAQGCMFKDRLVVRETDDDGSRIHVFAIRKKAPQWIHPAGEIMPRRVVDLFADFVCSVDEGILG